MGATLPPPSLGGLRIGTAADAAANLPGFGSFQDLITMQVKAQGAASGLNPSALGTLLSLDLDPGTGLLNASGLSPADGDLVASWADSRANGLTATQATVASQPQYIKNGYNAQPCLRFTGAAFMTMPDNVALRPDSQPFRVFMVCRATNIPSTRTLLSKGNGVSTAQGYALTLDTASFVESAYVRVCDSTGGRGSQNIANPPYQASLIELALDGTGTIQGFLNGSATGWANGGEGPSGNTYTPPVQNTDALTIMGSNGVAYQSVDVYRLLIVKGALTTAQLASIRLYLQTLYPPQAPDAITINTATRQAIFTNGVEAPFIRIPSLITTTRGTVIAFAEARQANGDTAITTIVCKRSTDGGVTWSAPINVIGDGVHCFANNVPIVDRQTGRIHMMCGRYTPPDTQAQVIQGTGTDTARGFYAYSDDDGLTWSTPREVTSSVKQSGWADYHPGPGHAEQLANGRLLWPCYYSSSTIGSTTSPNTGASALAAHVVYSDDHGATFHIGAVTTISGLNENRVVQHPMTGQLLFTGRNENAAGRRFIWTSNDGGLTITTPVPCWDLETQICNSSLYSLGGNNLLHVGPIGPNTRDHVAARISTDFGQSWPATTVIDASASGYSDVVLLPDGTYGCMYEAVVTGTFVFFKFTIAYPKWKS